MFVGPSGDLGPRHSSLRYALRALASSPRASVKHFGAALHVTWMNGKEYPDKSSISPFPPSLV